jgi:pimeloyl-ACP methyl ester carboxylesterase
MRVLRRVVLAVLGLLAGLWLAVTIYAYWPGPAEVPARELATDADRFVAVDGMELRYRSWGAPGPGRPSLVLVHGFANSLQSFRLLAPRLAGTFHVVTVDAPGFGLSSKPADRDYGNASQARAIADFAAALGLERYVIGGHSMGGTLAVYVAATDPHVVGVVLMNPGIITTGVPAFSQYLPFPMQRVMARNFGRREFRADFLRRSYVDPGVVTEQVIDELMLAARSEGYLEGTAHMMGQYETGEEPDFARRVRVPTLIIWGLQDRSKPPGELEAVQALIPGSEVVRVANAGHYVHEEQPEVVAAALIAAAPRWLEDPRKIGN